jgi:hypothetical protein
VMGSITGPGVAILGQASSTSPKRMAYRATARALSVSGYWGLPQRPHLWSEGIFEQH